MRIQFKILSHNLKQQVPSILIQLKSNSRKFYMFNICQQFNRYMPKYYISLNSETEIFFTRYNTHNVSGLSCFLLELHERRSNFRKKIYLNQKTYRYAIKMRELFGFRILPLSFYNFDSFRYELGIKDNQQLKKLMNLQKFKSKFIRGIYTNQQKIKYLTQPVNPSRLIKKQQNSAKQWYFEDRNIQIRPILINKQNKKQTDIFYNYICTTLEQVYKNKFYVQNYDQQNRRGYYKQKEQESVLKQKQEQEQEYKWEQEWAQSSKNAANSNNKFDFMILHYRTKDNIRQLTSSPTFTKYLTQLQKQPHKRGLNTVIHIIEGDGSTVFSEQFAQLRKILPNTTNHVIYNQYCRFYNTEQQFRQEIFKIYYNYQFCYHMFPIAGNYMVNLMTVLLDQYRKDIYWKNLSTITDLQKYPQEQYGMVYFFKPSYGVNISARRGFQFSQLLLAKSTTKQKRFVSSSIPPKDVLSTQKVLKQKLALITKQFDPKIIFLGTSSKNSIYLRNVSGIMIKVPKSLPSQNGQVNGNFSIILDCGDGIYNQIVNHFGQKSQQQLLNLKILFLTHMHLDHCSGIFQLLAHRNKIINTKLQTYKQQTQRQRQSQKYKLFLIMPKNMMSWYQVFAQSFQQIANHTKLIFTQSISNPHFQQKVQKYQLRKVKNSQKFFNRVTQKKQNVFQLSQCQISEDIMPEQQNSQNVLATQKYKQNQNVGQFLHFLSKNKIKKFLPTPVRHCKQSYGIIIQHESSVKISYSGDCRPTQLFQQQIKNSTLLIHEATYQQNQIQKAILRKHSTRKQAIQAGYKSNSLITALTHFQPLRKQNASLYQNQYQYQYQYKNQQQDQYQHQYQYQHKPQPQPQHKHKPQHRPQHRHKPKQTDKYISKYSQTGKQLQSNQYKQYNKNYVIQSMDHFQFLLSQMYRMPYISKKLLKNI